MNGTPNLRADATDEPEWGTEAEGRPLPASEIPEYAKGGIIRADKLSFEVSRCLYEDMGLAAVRHSAAGEFVVKRDPDGTEYEAYENGDGGWSYRPVR